jgi:hypothetical protein
LEARVESARRASEIHKRRTGRSLRVTEQDVINEEMYGEEEDDLPSQYRQLTAHLQTTSTAFNQRLAAYLTGQVGVRSAIDQYLSNSYAQGFPNGQRFLQNQQPMYPNPALNQQFQQQMMQASPNSMYRQAPYPMPNMQQRMHARSASIANPQMTSNKTQSPVAADEEKRRQSIATVPTSTTSPAQTPTAATPQSNQASTPKTMSVATPQAGFSQPQPTTQSFPLPYRPGNFNSDHSLFTTALPQESQMLLGSALDPRDPMTNMLMTGSQYMPNSYYNFDSTLPPTFNVGKDFTGGQMYPSFDGLNATLAPSDLELNSGLDCQYAGQTSFFDAGMKETTASGTGTPGGNGDFSLFIDQDQWNDVSSSQ